MSSSRRSKVVALEEAVAMVETGMTLAIGGYWYHNQPAAFARALVRSGVGGLRLTGAPVGGYAHDLLIGAGVVNRLLTPHISFDELGLSPNLRRAAESGELSIGESEEACLIGGFRAAAQDLAALPVRSLSLTEVIEHSPLVRPSSGDLALREAIALAPDVAVIHVAYADQYGNGCHLGSPLADRLLARVSRRVILTAERIAANDEIRADPRHTSVLGLWVDAVVEMPLGAHPCSCHGVYGEDRTSLESYIEAGEARRRGDPGPYQRYLSQVAALSPADYRQLAAGEAGRLASRGVPHDD
jgi:glutaconate CoA-transferase subunit A